MTMKAKREIDMRHWLCGGTGALNFEPHEEPRYLKAIAEHGDEQIQVVRKPMVGFENHTFYSLHYTGDRRCLPEFWSVFDMTQP